MLKRISRRLNGLHEITWNINIELYINIIILNHMYIECYKIKKKENAS